MRFRMWFGCALVALLLLNVAVAVSLLRPPEYAMVLAPSDIQPDSGVAYATRVRLGGLVFKVESDQDSSARSKLRMFEGRTELKPAHVLHAEIREKGAGRFSHWGEWIYFSASDNSDPRRNGQIYLISAAATLNTDLLIALAVLDLVCFAVLRIVLLRRYGGSAVADRISPPAYASRLSPFAVAALATATAFGLAWFCGLTYRTNDDVFLRAIAEGAIGSGRPSEFIFFQNILAGLVLRALYTIAPQFPWYDSFLVAGTGAGALVLLTAVLRLCRSRRETVFCALLGLVVFTGIFSNLQFSAAATLLAGGAVALLISVAFRPPVSRARLLMCVAVAAAAFFWGSLFRFAAALLAAALVAPMLLLSTRQRVAALRIPLAGLCAGVLLAMSGMALDAAYYRFSPGWENFRTEKQQRLAVSEYLHADFLREREMNAALAAVEWSRNDYDLITGWMFAVPDIFSMDRLTRFAALAPSKSLSERLADFYQTMVPGRDVMLLFAVLCILAVVMVRSFYALAVVFVSACWLLLLMMALSVVYKPAFLHILWMLCGTVSLVAVGTAFAGATYIRREGYYLIEDTWIARAVLAALCCAALWQVLDMRADSRAADELRARLTRDLAAWPAPPQSIVVAWDADFPFEMWEQPFRAPPRYGWRFFNTEYSSVSPLTAPIYARWGTTDVLWALCHVPGMYLVDARRRGYADRHARMLTTYMRERHAEAVTLVPAFDGEATSLLACRPETKGG